MKRGLAVFGLVLCFQFLSCASLPQNHSSSAGIQSRKTNSINLESFLTETIGGNQFREQDEPKVTVQQTKTIATYWEADTKTLTIFNYPLDDWEVKISRAGKSEFEISFAAPAEVNDFMDKMFEEHHRQNQNLTLVDFPLRFWEVEMADADNDGIAEIVTLLPPKEMYYLMTSLFKEEGGEAK